MIQTLKIRKKKTTKSTAPKPAPEAGMSLAQIRDAYVSLDLESMDPEELLATAKMLQEDAIRGMDLTVAWKRHLELHGIPDCENPFR